MNPKPVVKVSCVRMVEGGKGPSWWTTLHNSAGQTITPSVHRERDDALIDVAEWASFFGIDPEPYIEDGETIEPSFRLGEYDPD